MGWSESVLKLPPNPNAPALSVAGVLKVTFSLLPVASLTTAGAAAGASGLPAMQQCRHAYGVDAEAWHSRHACAMPHSKEAASNVQQNAALPCCTSQSARLTRHGRC